MSDWENKKEIGPGDINTTGTPYDHGYSQSGFACIFSPSILIAYQKIRDEDPISGSMSTDDFPPNFYNQSWVAVDLWGNVAYSFYVPRTVVDPYGSSSEYGKTPWNRFPGAFKIAGYLPAGSGSTSMGLSLAFMCTDLPGTDGHVKELGVY